MTKIFIISSLSTLPLVNTSFAKNAPKRAKYLSTEVKSLGRNLLSNDVYTPNYYLKIVHLENRKNITIKSLLSEANKIAKSEKAPKQRPIPVLDKNGKIAPFVKIFSPTKKGPLSGKTIIVNAGHGGYNPSNGFFDRGTYAKDSKNKLIEEWYKNQNFAMTLIPLLREKGAKVVYLQGHVKNVAKSKRKFAKSHAFISIHCDALPSHKFGATIKFKDSNDKKLAGVVGKALKNCALGCTVDASSRNLAVLREVSAMPSILVETGNMANVRDLRNIDSQECRSSFCKNLAQGIVNFFKK